MRRLVRCCSAISSFLLVAGYFAPIAVLAQDQGGPPNILVIEREFPKPGRGGAIHEKSEAAFIHELDAAKASPRYIALNSMSGADRAVFLSGYDSMAQWEAEAKSVFGNATLSASLDRANVADGDLLASSDSSVWRLQQDMSLRDHSSMVGMRYMRVTVYTIRPGHGDQWDELVKMARDGSDKGVPEANWAYFSHVYGGSATRALIITPMKSLAEDDARFASGKALSNALGEDAMKKFDELEASSVESIETNLFVFNPRMSRPPESWVKAEPSFWRPKMTAEKKATAAKPAATAGQ